MGREKSYKHNRVSSSTANLDCKLSWICNTKREEDPVLHYFDLQLKTDHYKKKKVEFFVENEVFIL